MKNYHLVPEGHQCLGSFQEVGNIFQKSKIADVMFFLIRLRKFKKIVKISLMVLKGLMVLLFCYFFAS